jgi:hypothetical protein
MYNSHFRNEREWELIKKLDQWRALTYRTVACRYISLLHSQFSKNIFLRDRKIVFYPVIAGSHLIGDAVRETLENTDFHAS